MMKRLEAELDGAAVEAIKALFSRAVEEKDPVLLKEARDLYLVLQQQLEKRVENKAARRRQLIGLIIGSVFALVWITGVFAAAIWGKVWAGVTAGTTSIVLVSILIIIVLGRAPEPALARVFGWLGRKDAAARSQSAIGEGQETVQVPSSAADPIKAQEASPSDGSNGSGVDGTS
jgi:hypothetical protein